MPTVLRSGPYRFFFDAGDRDEPPRVHVERDNSEAKFWLDPIRLRRSHGFSANIGDGRGIHWPELDEDISVENLLAGKHSGERQTSFKKWLDQRPGNQARN